MALSSARSCGLKIRSSCSNVWEKESRTCFGVMADTPPCVERIGLGNPHCRGSSTDNTTSKRESPRKFLRGRSKKRGLRSRLPRDECRHHGLENLYPVGAAQLGFRGALRAATPIHTGSGSRCRCPAPVLRPRQICAPTP